MKRFRVLSRFPSPTARLSISIYYGIKTGYNRAFFITTPTRDQLVAEDPRSAEILKPILRGEDIQRYRAEWAGLWLIAAHNGYGDVPRVHVEDYPAIKQHLDGFFSRLATRADKGTTPYNLRNCAYHADFRKRKLFWMKLARRGRFALSDSEIYCNDAVFFVRGHSLKWLCAVLNSTLATWMIRKTARTTGAGLTQWDKFVLETLPVPLTTVDQQAPLVRTVDAILHAKDADAATSDLEWEADRLVSTSYGLTEREGAVLARGW